jgi:UPF0148 protein
MSDSDDGFDEEAVREELREKYENEQEDREATARMSELLLQGATMTNDHCDRCGSPLFRYEGQTFCPTCQHEAQRQQADAGQSDAQQADAGQPETQHADSGPTGGQQAPPNQPQSGVAGGDGQQPASGDAGGETDSRRAPPSRSGGERAPDTGRGGERSRDVVEDAPARDDPSTRDLPEHAPTASATGPAADALESTIAALARRAGSADDPRTAREYLEAAREAAEALAALRQ